MAVAASAGYVLASLSINGKNANRAGQNDAIRKRPKTALERETERRERRRRHGCRHCRRNHRNKSLDNESSAVIEPQLDGRNVEVRCIICNKVLATNVNNNNDNKDEVSSSSPTTAGSSGEASRKSEPRIFIRSCCADFRGRLSKTGGGSLLRAARSGNLERLTNLLDNENIDIQTANTNGLAAIHLAAKEGHCDVIKELLYRKAPVDQQTKRGNTALHVASLAGRLPVVTLLIEKGANPNSKAQNDFTPLYMAAQEGFEDIVEYLLKNGANQGIPTEDGFTPLAVALQENKDKVVSLLLNNDVKGKVKLPALHIAARKDDVKAAALLLQNDNTADPTSKSGFTALHIAAHYGNVNVATLLLNRGAVVDFEAKSGITPLHVAAKRGQSRFCALILERDGRPDKATRDGLIALHCAARSGHCPVVKMLIDNSITPKLARTKNGLSALHMATQGGHHEVVELLLREDFPVDDVTLDKLSALHISAHSGYAEITKILLMNNANPNKTALNGFTALHVACKKNRVEVVELLLENKVNIEAVTESGLTPLHIACFMGNFDVVRLLAKKGSDLNSVNVRGETALHMATRSGRYDIVEFLLQQGAKPDARKQESQTCLHLASRLYKTEVIKLLLEYKANVNSVMHDGYTPLHIATKENHVEVCQMLVDYGADISLTTKKGFTALHLASKYGRIEIASMLLKHKASPDACGKDGLTPLHVAAHYDNQHIALLLLQHGASPHLPGKNGYTPLHIASKKNQMDIALCLLEYNASPDSLTRMDVTPLHLAAQEGNVDMCSILLSKEAGVNASAKFGITPMHLAAQEDQVAVAKVLYDNGSLVDPLTKSGCTPLHIAAHHGNMKVANFLLSFGAKVNAKTKNGYTPLHQAAQQGHTHVVNLLIQHGASPNELTNSGNTALSLADRLGYVTLVETLKQVTTETTTTVIEERKKFNVPESLGETFISDASDDEDGSVVGGDFLTTTEMKELGDDSIMPKQPSTTATSSDTRYSTMNSRHNQNSNPRSSLSSSTSAFGATDNINYRNKPKHGSFLASFVVDACGGVMKGTRQNNLRVIIPPNVCPGPTRITCRFTRRRKLTSLMTLNSNNPSMFDAEGKANRVLEIGPQGTSFLGPVAIEVPHFASLAGNFRQLAVLRSNDGETWKEHKAPCSDEVFIKQHSTEELQNEETLLTEKKVLRIITSTFPKFFAIVSRPIENAIVIDSNGGDIESSVVSRARVFFPAGALTKKITIALQMLPVPSELCKKAVGMKAKASSIFTIEPRRRKFHKPIKLTIPLPEGTNMKNYLSSTDDSTLRLLCSISGGADTAKWEDITGSTPLNFLDDCVSFTSTVSARFWLIDCREISESIPIAHEIYTEATRVPYLSKFVVYAKSYGQFEATVRILCLSEDRNERTLEDRENFIEIARSKDIEIFEGSQICVECSGNLSMTKSATPTRKFIYAPFTENRMQMLVKVRDSTQESCGRLSFYRSSGGPPKSHGARKTLCSLNITLPEFDQSSGSESEEEEVLKEENDEINQGKKRYYLVDPASAQNLVQTPDKHDSPNEIAKDLQNVLSQLNTVRSLLETTSQTDLNHSLATPDIIQQSDQIRDNVPINQAVSVVYEVKKGLSEVMDILSQEEKALNEVNDDFETVSSIYSSSQDLTSKSYFDEVFSQDQNVFINEIKDESYKIEDRIEKDVSIEETIKQINDDEDLKKLFAGGNQALSSDQTDLKVASSSLRMCSSSHSLARVPLKYHPIMRSQSCGAVKSVRFSTCVEIIDPCPSSSSRLPFLLAPISDRKSNLPRDASFECYIKKDDYKSSESSASEEDSDSDHTPPQMSLQQRVLAYEAATNELREEVERFRNLTSPKEALKTTSDDTNAVQSFDSKQEVIDVKEKLEAELSPSVVEEHHSVHEILLSWEQSQSFTDNSNREQIIVAPSVNKLKQLNITNKLSSAENTSEESNTSDQKKIFKIQNSNTDDVCNAESLSQAINLTNSKDSHEVKPDVFVCVSLSEAVNTRVESEMSKDNETLTANEVSLSGITLSPTQVTADTVLATQEHEKMYVNTENEIKDEDLFNESDEVKIAENRCQQPNKVSTSTKIFIDPIDVEKQQPCDKIDDNDLVISVFNKSKDVSLDKKEEVQKSLTSSNLLTKIDKYPPSLKKMEIHVCSEKLNVNNKTENEKLFVEKDEDFFTENDDKLNEKVLISDLDNDKSRDSTKLLKESEVFEDWSCDSSLQVDIECELSSTVNMFEENVEKKTTDETLQDNSSVDTFHHTKSYENTSNLSAGTKHTENAENFIENRKDTLDIEINENIKRDYSEHRQDDCENKTLNNNTEQIHEDISCKLREAPPNVNIEEKDSNKDSEATSQLDEDFIRTPSSFFSSNENFDDKLTNTLATNSEGLTLVAKSADKSYLQSNGDIIHKTKAVQLDDILGVVDNEAAVEMVEDDITENDHNLKSQKTQSLPVHDMTEVDHKSVQDVSEDMSMSKISCQDEKLVVNEDSEDSNDSQQLQMVEDRSNESVNVENKSVNLSSFSTCLEDKFISNLNSISYSQKMDIREDEIKEDTTLDSQSTSSSAFITEEKADKDQLNEADQSLVHFADKNENSLPPSSNEPCNRKELKEVSESKSDEIEFTQMTQHAESENSLNKDFNLMKKTSHLVSYNEDELKLKSEVMPESSSNTTSSSSDEGDESIGDSSNSNIGQMGSCATFDDDEDDVCYSLSKNNPSLTESLKDSLVFEEDAEETVFDDQSVLKPSYEDKLCFETRHTYAESNFNKQFSFENTNFEGSLEKANVVEQTSEPKPPEEIKQVVKEERSEVNSSSNSNNFNDMTDSRETIDFKFSTNDVRTTPEKTRDTEEALKDEENKKNYEYDSIKYLDDSKKQQNLIFSFDNKLSILESCGSDKSSVSADDETMKDERCEYYNPKSTAPAEEVFFEKNQVKVDLAPNEQCIIKEQAKEDKNSLQLKHQLTDLSFDLKCDPKSSDLLDQYEFSKKQERTAQNKQVDDVINSTSNTYNQANDLSNLYTESDESDSLYEVQTCKAEISEINSKSESICTLDKQLDTIETDSHSNAIMSHISNDELNDLSDNKQMTSANRSSLSSINKTLDVEDVASNLYNVDKADDVKIVEDQQNVAKNLSVSKLVIDNNKDDCEEIAKESNEDTDEKLFAYKAVNTPGNILTELAYDDRIVINDSVINTCSVPKITTERLSKQNEEVFTTICEDQLRSIDEKSAASIKTVYSTDDLPENDLESFNITQSTDDNTVPENDSSLDLEITDIIEKTEESDFFDFSTNLISHKESQNENLESRKDQSNTELELILEKEVTDLNETLSTDACDDEKTQSILIEDSINESKLFSSDSLDEVTVATDSIESSQMLLTPYVEAQNYIENSFAENETEKESLNNLKSDHLLEEDKFFNFNLASANQIVEVNNSTTELEDKSNNSKPTDQNNLLPSDHDSSAKDLFSGHTKQDQSLDACIANDVLSEAVIESNLNLLVKDSGSCIEIPVCENFSKDQITVLEQETQQEKCFELSEDEQDNKILINTVDLDTPLNKFDQYYQEINKVDECSKSDKSELDLLSQDDLPTSLHHISVDTDDTDVKEVTEITDIEVKDKIDKISPNNCELDEQLLEEKSNDKPEDTSSVCEIKSPSDSNQKEENFQVLQNVVQESEVGLLSSDNKTDEDESSFCTESKDHSLIIKDESKAEIGGQEQVEDITTVSLLGHTIESKEEKILDQKDASNNSSISQLDFSVRDENIEKTNMTSPNISTTRSTNPFKTTDYLQNENFQSEKHISTDILDTKPADINLSGDVRASKSSEVLAVFNKSPFLNNLANKNNEFFPVLDNEISDKNKIEISKESNEIYKTEVNDCLSQDFGVSHCSSQIIDDLRMREELNLRLSSPDEVSFTDTQTEIKSINSEQSEIIFNQAKVVEKGILLLKQNQKSFESVVDEFQEHQYSEESSLSDFKESKKVCDPHDNEEILESNLIEVDKNLEKFYDSNKTNLQQYSKEADSETASPSFSSTPTKQESLLDATTSASSQDDVDYSVTYASIRSDSNQPESISEQIPSKGINFDEFNLHGSHETFFKSETFSNEKVCKETELKDSNPLFNAILNQIDVGLAENFNNKSNELSKGIQSKSSADNNSPSSTTLDYLRNCATLPEIGLAKIYLQTSDHTKTNSLLEDKQSDSLDEESDNRGKEKVERKDLHLVDKDLNENESLKNVYSHDDSFVSTESVVTVKQYSPEPDVTDESTSVSGGTQYHSKMSSFDVQTDECEELSMELKQQNNQKTHESKSNTNKVQDSNFDSVSYETLSPAGLYFIENQSDSNEELEPEADGWNDNMSNDSISDQLMTDDKYICVGPSPEVLEYEPITSPPLPAIPEDEVLSPESICSPEIRRRGLGWLSDEEDEETKAEHMRSFAQKFSEFVANVRGGAESTPNPPQQSSHQPFSTAISGKSESSISSYFELEKVACTLDEDQVQDDSNVEVSNLSSSEFAIGSDEDQSVNDETHFESESFGTTTSFTDDFSEQQGLTDSFDFDDFDVRSAVSDVSRQQKSRIPIISRRRSLSSPEKSQEEITPRKTSSKSSHSSKRKFISRLKQPTRISMLNKPDESLKLKFISRNKLLKKQSRASNLNKNSTSLPSINPSKRHGSRKTSEEKSSRRHKILSKRIYESSPRPASPLSRSSSASSLQSGYLKKTRSGSSSPTSQDLAALRAEAFKNQGSGGRKYIALREGVYTYKMSLAEEKAAADDAKSRGSYKKRATKDSVSEVLGGGSFLVKGLGLDKDDGSYLTSIKVSPGKPKVVQSSFQSKIPRLISNKQSIPLKSPLDNVKEVNIEGVSHLRSRKNNKQLSDDVSKCRFNRSHLSEKLEVLKYSETKLEKETNPTSEDNLRLENNQNRSCENNNQEMLTKTEELRATAENLNSRYREVARHVGIQWPRLAQSLNINAEYVRKIQMEIDSSDVEGQSIAMFGTWLASNSNNERLDEELIKSLTNIGRSELVKYLREKENVFEEKLECPTAHDVSAFKALETELGSPGLKDEHVSSPYPFSPQEQLKIETIIVTKAEGDTEALNSVRDSIYEPDYDVDKPHFIYIQENESVQNNANTTEEAANQSDTDDGGHSSVSSSKTSVCSDQLQTNINEKIESLGSTPEVRKKLTIESDEEDDEDVKSESSSEDDVLNVNGDQTIITEETTESFSFTVKERIE